MVAFKLMLMCINITIVFQIFTSPGNYLGKHVDRKQWQLVYKVMNC